MKTEIRLPINFKEFPGFPIISNFDNSINAEIETAIKNKALFSRYSAWNFNGIVWWHDELGYWCAEVWVHRKYLVSYLAENLEELANEINDEHGKGEFAIGI